MKIDIVRLVLRILTFGLIAGRFKRKEATNGRLRGFAYAVFPKPASNWKERVDFLWEPKAKNSNFQELREEDWVIFFGYHTSSGWRAKLVIKLF